MPVFPTVKRYVVFVSYSIPATFLPFGSFFSKVHFKVTDSALYSSNHCLPGKWTNCSVYVKTHSYIQYNVFLYIFQGKCL